MTPEPTLNFLTFRKQEVLGKTDYRFRNIFYNVHKTESHENIHQPLLER